MLCRKSMPFVLTGLLGVMLCSSSFAVEHNELQIQSTELESYWDVLTSQSPGECQDGSCKNVVE